MRFYRAALVPLFLLLLAGLPLATYAATRSLSLGMSGSDVIALQTALINKGYLADGKNTGYFGALTLTALQKFQCDQKIICGSDTIAGYGIAGPKTQAALGNGGSIVSGSQNPGSITGTSLTGPYTGPLEFSGWIPDWRAASATLDTIPHLSQLKTVMPFGYSVSDTGTIIDSAHITQDPWPSFIAQARAQKSRVIPTIMWGDGVSIQNVLSNSTTRIALEDAIVNLVQQNNFDGIDIDFEAKQHETIDYYSTFLKGLYQRMGTKWVYCTVEARMPVEDRYSPGATIPADATDYANDYTALNKYCDRVEIMAYDQGTVDLRLNVARSAPYAPVADPGWVASIVTLAAQTIAKNKIVIGVPTYGYEYAVTPLSGSGYQYQRLWAFNPNYALGIAAQLGITPKRTSANELGFTYNPNALVTVAPTGSQTTETQQQTTPATTVAQNLGSQVDTTQPFNYVTWSDTQAIADKVSLARQLGVRGIAVFSLGGAEDQGMWNILK